MAKHIQRVPQKPVYSESFRDFLFDRKEKGCKIARILIEVDYYWDWEGKRAYRLWTTTDEVNYLTFRKDGTISYLPVGKEHKLTESGQWARDGRQNGRPAKIIRKLFRKRALKFIKDVEFESFCNGYKAKFCENGLRLELRPHQDISTVYDMRRAEGDGTLQNSCMHGEGDWLEIYDNCTKLSILTLVDKENRLHGRALVWKISDSITLMDRIYVTEDYQYQIFADYAVDKKWWYKVKYNSGDNENYYFNEKGDAVTKNFKVYTPTNFDHYPYIDTFSWGGDGWLQNHQDDDWYYEYQNTDGTRSPDDNEDEDSGYWDEIDECRIDEDDAVTIERGVKRHYCTHIDNTVQINGNYWWRRDPEIIELDGEWYHQDDVVYCEVWDGEDHPMEDCVTDHNGDWSLKDDSVEIDGEWYNEEDSDYIVKIDGDWYLKESDEVCEIDGEYYLKSDDKVVVNEDGEYVLAQLVIKF